MKAKLILIFLFTCFLYSCQKQQANEEKQVSPPMSGKVVWPTYSQIDTTGVRVSSFSSAVALIGDTYVVDTINKFSTIFVSNAAGDVLMMRYNFPGQIDNNITSQSTALAILMNAPVVTSLSDIGQVSMINKIQSDPNYNSLVEEVNMSIVSNRAINDTTNIALIQATSRLFVSVAARIDGYETVPLNIKTANPGTFSFENNNVAHKYVVGVYKDNVRLKKLVVEGTQAYASSFRDVLDGVFGNGYSTPDVQIYSNIEDGRYNFRIRSGKPGLNDNSVEAKEAFRENISLYIFQLVKKHLPLSNQQCTNAVYAGIKTMIDGTQSFNNVSTPDKFAGTVLQSCSDFFNTRTSLFKDCSLIKDPFNKNPFYSGASKIFKFFDKVGLVGQGLNVGAQVYDLYFSRPAIDTCFNVVSKKVELCCDDYATRSILSGGNYKRWKLTQYIHYNANGVITLIVVAPQIATKMYTFGIDGSLEAYFSRCGDANCTYSIFVTGNAEYSICNNNFTFKNWVATGSSVGESGHFPFDKIISVSAGEFRTESVRNNLGWTSEVYTPF